MSSDNYELARKVARLRHKHTNYDKNIDLMYDKDGNPTALRRHINSVLSRIAEGKLSKDYLIGLKSEIKYEKTKKIKENRLKNLAKKPKKKKKKQQSIESSQRRLMNGYKMMCENQKYKYLQMIGLRPKQLHKMWRKALPFYKSEKNKKSTCTDETNRL